MCEALSTVVGGLRPVVGGAASVLRLHEVGTRQQLRSHGIARCQKRGTMAKDSEFVMCDATELARVHGGMAGPMWDAMQKVNELGLQVQGVITGNHAVSSRHWRGRGMDIGGSEANLWKFVEWAKGTNYHEVIYKNKFFKDGRSVPGIGNHDDHAHYSF
jgi:hypothetical protein